MGLETRELYSSANGDKWLLAHERDSGRVLVRHIPGAFLCERSYGPQHMELLRLIGTLVEKRSDSGAHEPGAHESSIT